ncbi:hypothetical protein OG780_19410 [Streptomyces sp. NBC_00386]|uniref:hypothetical protein n=1 Tax=Streptomyces sp. NBC_00386 TaxID=2975734 RepID=UPI002E23F8B9
MTGKQLTTQNATITTATVEVKTLTISGKQVTLAVFRQLREEPVISSDGTLNGEPWGTVNYHPDKCGDEPDHWHVVWQSGGELLRSLVDKKADFDFTTATGNRLSRHWHSGDTADRYLTALVYMGLMAGGDPVLDVKRQLPATYWTEGAPDSYAAKCVLSEALAGTDVFPVQATAVEGAVDAANLASRLRVAKVTASKELTEAEKSRSEEWRATFTANRRYAVEEAERKFADSMAAVRALIEEWGGFDAIDSAYTSAIETEGARRQAHRGSRAAIAELPQLFIAV